MRLAKERSGTFVVWRGDTAVSDPTSIGERSGFCRQIHRLGRSDRTPSSFGEVILPSAIQLLLGDDRAFAVRSTVLIHRPGRSDRTPSSFGEVILSSAIQFISGDDRTFVVKSTVLVVAIGHFVVWRGDTAVSDPTSIGGRLDFCCQIHRPGRSDRASSSFGEVEVKLYHRRLLGEAKVEMHRRRPLKATTY
ncbi:hypothetical protein E5676_scaffold606G00610 [Cucumis melo var. makuwa]|uniref:Uncharacterized protein n=1 Tax=Cucumis melo var. makuwa TaxID=1194695 RepID=A0A5D3C768_CUCMM|nr:hypothetical protein E5676_scaffold606G00610 [Cucumis melo var. makuwa]